MNTFLLTWNPNRWDWEEIAKYANETAAGKVVSGGWSSGVTKKIMPGDRVFLMRLGKDPLGIVGSGWATSKPRYESHWDYEKAAAGKKSLHVECKWERLLNPDVDLPLPVLKINDKKFKEFNWTPQASGVEISKNITTQLENAWGIHIAKSTLGNVDADTELSFFEGKEKIAFVRHRRREQKLRSAKLAAALEKGKGRLNCEVEKCGFNFYKVYGQLGFEFAHVHHLNPLADRSEPTKTKLSDLAIVCANCHAMIHRKGACRSLKGLIP